MCSTVELRWSTMNTLIVVVIIHFTLIFVEDQIQLKAEDCSASCEICTTVRIRASQSFPQSLKFVEHHSLFPENVARIDLSLRDSRIQVYLDWEDISYLQVWSFHTKKGSIQSLSPWVTIIPCSSTKYSIYIKCNSGKIYEETAACDRFSKASEEFLCSIPSVRLWCIAIGRQKSLDLI